MGGAATDVMNLAKYLFLSEEKFFTIATGTKEWTSVCVCVCVVCECGFLYDPTSSTSYL